MPVNKPQPRTSPIIAWAGCNAYSACRRYSPTAELFCKTSLLSISSSTAIPTAACKGLEAKVLKYRDDFRKASMLSALAATAARGSPLPIGLPMQTISGLNPFVSYPQKSPDRQNPAWTSSAMISPPAACTISVALAMNWPGTSGKPSLAKIEHTNMPANGVLFASKSAIAARTLSRYRLHSASSSRPAWRGLYFWGKGIAR